MEPTGPCRDAGCSLGEGGSLGWISSGGVTFISGFDGLRLLPSENRFYEVKVGDTEL